MIDLEESRACITVAIVSANQLVRIGLHSVLRARQHIQLVGIAASAREAEEVVTQHQPQVLLIEWRDGCETLKLVQTIKASAPSTQLIALSGVNDGMHIQAALSAGIHGFVLNIQPPAVLVATIEHVARGATGMGMAESSRTGHTFSPRAKGIGHVVFSSRAGAGLEELTKREREIITLIGEGLSNKAIADRLCISSTTVRHHLTSIFDKLGVTTRQKLLICAYRRGLVEVQAFASPASIDL
ncbi:MAG: response regulator transcription factor [Nitrospira sp.]|nr:response regulator transcription factor [Nitrospira sp.]